MKKDSRKAAYIGIEREGNSLKYIAKVLNEPPSQITRAQYNAIVKALGGQNWATTVEDEATVISRIITNNLTTADE